MPTDYGNSNKNKRAAAETADDSAVEKNIEAVVTTPVIVKKPGIGHRFKTVFFGGDFRGAAVYVAADVLLPALRNLMVDTLTKGIERTVYGDSRPMRRPTMGYGTTSRINYRGVSTPPLRPALPDQGPVSRLRGEPNQVIIVNKDEADMALERLCDIADQFGAVSVADLHSIIAMRVAAIDHKWGWTDLSSAEVRQTREGFLLHLPPVEEL